MYQIFVCLLLFGKLAMVKSRQNPIKLMKRTSNLIGVPHYLQLVHPCLSAPVKIHPGGPRWKIGPKIGAPVDPGEFFVFMRTPVKTV